MQKYGARLLYVGSGRIRSQADGRVANRLATILVGLAEVIESYAPVEVAVEKVFVNVNPQSTLALGQARGTAICAAVLAGLPVAGDTALSGEASVVGIGHADKEQEQPLVVRPHTLPCESTAISSPC